MIDHTELHVEWPDLLNCRTKSLIPRSYAHIWLRARRALKTLFNIVEAPLKKKKEL